MKQIFIIFILRIKKSLLYKEMCNGPKYPGDNNGGGQ